MNKLATLGKHSEVAVTEEQSTKVCPYCCSEIAEIENSVFRLSVAIKQTTRRANALKNIMIPRFKSEVKFITEALEEKEREEFSRMKLIKKKKVRDAQENESA